MASGWAESKEVPSSTTSAHAPFPLGTREPLVSSPLGHLAATLVFGPRLCDALCSIYREFNKISIKEMKTN